MYRVDKKKWFLSFPVLLAALSAATLAFITVGKAGAPAPVRSRYATFAETARERGYFVEESLRAAPSGAIADYGFTLSKGIVPAGGFTFTVEGQKVVSVSNHDEDNQDELLLLDDLFVEDGEIYLNAERLNSYFDLMDAEVERRSEFVVGPEESQRLLTQYCSTEDELQYYAYLDYESAEKNIRRVILAARNQIVFRFSWCDDNVNSCVTGVDGQVKERTPHFHDLFPADWEVPIHPVIREPNGARPAPVS